MWAFKAGEEQTTWPEIPRKPSAERETSHGGRVIRQKKTGSWFFAVKKKTTPQKNNQTHTTPQERHSLLWSSPFLGNDEDIRLYKYREKSTHLEKRKVVNNPHWRTILEKQGQTKGLCGGAKARTTAKGSVGGEKKEKTGKVQVRKRRLWGKNPLQKVLKGIKGNEPNARTNENTQDGPLVPGKNLEGNAPASRPRCCNRAK